MHRFSVVKKRSQNRVISGRLVILPTVTPTLRKVQCRRGIFKGCGVAHRLMFRISHTPSPIETEKIPICLRNLHRGVACLPYLGAGELSYPMRMSNWAWTVIFQGKSNLTNEKKLLWQWVVDRTLAWLNHSKRLSKGFEISTASTETLVKISHVHTLLKCS